MVAFNSQALNCSSVLVENQLLEYSSWRDLPKVDLRAIEAMKEYLPKYRGFKLNTTHTGLLNGERVFIKTYPTYRQNIDTMSKFVSFNALLSRLGFGPKFLGVGINSDGEPYTVNEFARGRFFIFNQMKWPYVLKDRSSVENFTRNITTLFSRLSSLGVVVGNLQMFVLENGEISVVDTDEFGLLSGEKAEAYNLRMLEKIKSYLSKIDVTE